MWFGILAFWMILFLCEGASAQVTASPTPTPRPGSRTANVPGVVADNANYDRLRSIELMTPKDRVNNHPLLDGKKGIYRRPNKEETQALAVAELLIDKYAAFLRGPDTGIVKLNGEFSCISDTDTVVASEKCLPFTMPGAGTAYSFRTESYRLPRLADVILFDGVFKTGGVFQQVLMTEIGDVAIEDVTLNTAGLKYLVQLEPVSDTNEFLRFESDVAKGIERDGFFYRKGYPVKVNSTFVLRSIAYRGKYMRSVDGIAYDELDYDKRRDIIAAFRVADVDTKGNATIVWKIFQNTEAPRLKISK